jgi:FAD/FMN-containing dehydrogenase
VRIDAAKQRAYVEPGATLADFDAAAQASGLATPLGVNSTTGISGLTLGGGFGWLTRKFGMTVDNLLAADVVTAEGARLHASEGENAELFWALRGGGGNFGVVTGFEFELHPVGPEILAGLIVFPFAQAEQVLRRYRAFAASAPEDLSVWVVMRHAPPLPFLPATVHGEKVVVLALAHFGDASAGETAIAPLHGFGDAVGHHLARQPYVQWQQAFDPLLTPGVRNYWKSHNFTELGDELLDTVIQSTGALPGPHCEVFIPHLAGAANRIAADATAYVARDAKFVLNVHARWEDPADDSRCIEWARTLFRNAAPWASGGAYVNFMTAEEGGRIEQAYGANHARLTRAKRQYDPQNVFHMNQNIRP